MKKFYHSQQIISKSKDTRNQYFIEVIRMFNRQSPLMVILGTLLGISTTPLVFAQGGGKVIQPTPGGLQETQNSLTIPSNTKGPGLSSGSSGIVTHKDLVEAAQPRVRIGLRLTTFLKTISKDPEGKAVESYVSREPLRHTLRARLNKVNHFYFGSWHVETTPQKWIRESRRYDIRLSLYRRYGAYDLLEELVGHVDLSGTLENQEENIYLLKGVVRERIRDKFGFPLLDVVAGYEPEGSLSTGQMSPIKPSARPSGKG